MHHRFNLSGPIIIIRAAYEYIMTIHKIWGEIKITSAERTLCVHKLEIDCAFVIGVKRRR